MPDKDSTLSYKLEVRGYATDHIWALANEVHDGAIGLRFDTCGEHGTLFLTKRQAHDVINVLNDVLSQM